MNFQWSTYQRVGFALLVGLCASVIIGVWLYHKHSLGKEFESRGLERNRYGFRDAVITGDVEAVNLYLADGFSPNSRFFRSETPILLRAAGANQLEVLRALIEAGADVGAASRFGGYQAIHVAAAEAHPEVLRELLKAGADPNAIGNSTEGGAFVPIYHAASASPTGVRLSERERIGETEERVETVRALLEHGAGVNRYHPYLNLREQGDGPLHQAARHGFDETVRLLLAHGAEIERIDHWGNTPLMSAASGGRASTAEILLAAGAQPNKRTQRGTALLLASHVCPEALRFVAPAQRCVEVVRILLAAGADPRLTNAEGKTAYDVAHNPAIVRLLKTAQSQKNRVPSWNAAQSSQSGRFWPLCTTQLTSQGH